MFADELIESLKTYQLARRQIKQMSLISHTENTIPGWWDN